MDTSKNAFRLFQHILVKVVVSGFKPNNQINNSLRVKPDCGRRLLNGSEVSEAIQKI